MASIEDSKKHSAPIRAECFLLCDQAQAENGKLYILGGGWDQLTPQTIPVYHTAAIALKMVMPGRTAMETVAIRIDIFDSEGRPIGEPVVRGNIKGSPVGEFPDGSIDLAPDAAIYLAFTVGLDIQQAGRYGLRLIANGDVVAETQFTVIAPPVEDEPTATDG